VIAAVYRSHLKKVFSADIVVKPSSQILDILEYACGLILGPAFLSRHLWREISTENPNFEIDSNRIPNFICCQITCQYLKLFFHSLDDANTINYNS
jgi:hypothetical protein